MISWSGRGEDQVLYRMYGDTKKGTYIDIGSALPRYGSVTYGLYTQGWRGICIDPRPKLQKSWNKLRPNDIFLNYAITPKSSNGYIIDEGFRTKFVESESSNFDINSIPVKSITVKELANCWFEAFSLDPDIIKIDIEGGEVLIANELLKQGFRPSIWIIEVVDQSGSNHIRRSEGINLEKIMKKFNYQLTLMDGVNEWYLNMNTHPFENSKWAPAYPGVEDFIPFHLTTNYRLKTKIYKILQTIKSTIVSKTD